ncbi:hypothetical protein EAG_02624 [Camponotus floridanus]|uniref:Uncharacterized protein n=1 Tax=Camponotus floridanus TaxID=104421 RepID=E2AXU5_CAMFO|nr:hypothetical protein EAG_02624 [Camponotus floridanus]
MEKVTAKEVKYRDPAPPLAIYRSHINPSIFQSNHDSEFLPSPNGGVATVKLPIFTLDPCGRATPSNSSSLEGGGETTPVSKKISKMRGNRRGNRGPRGPIPLSSLFGEPQPSANVPGNPKETTLEGSRHRKECKPPPRTLPLCHILSPGLPDLAVTVPLSWRGNTAPGAQLPKLPYYKLPHYQLPHDTVFQIPY